MRPEKIKQTANKLRVAVSVQCLSVQLQRSACQYSCSAVLVSTVAVQCQSVQLQRSACQYSCSAVPVSTVAVQCQSVQLKCSACQYSCSAFPSHQTATPDSQVTDPRLWPEYSGWRCRVRPPQLEKADMAKAEGRRATAGEGWSEGCRSNRSNRSTIYQLTDHYYHPKKKLTKKKKSCGGGDLQMAP